MTQILVAYPMVDTGRLTSRPLYLCSWNQRLGKQIVNIYFLWQTTRSLFLSVLFVFSVGVGVHDVPRGLHEETYVRMNGTFDESVSEFKSSDPCARNPFVHRFFFTARNGDGKGWDVMSCQYDLIKKRKNNKKEKGDSASR